MILCFDTTASNTGKFNVACTNLEALLNHPLWTACRHHMHKVILSQVFKSIFGKSSSPQITFFEILKKKWSTINFAVYTIHVANSSVEVDLKILDNAIKAFHEIKFDSHSYISRDDYAELLDLVLHYLNNNSFGTYRFRLPGAQHRAHWMSSAIYALTMLVLQSQLDVDAKILKG